MTEPTILGTPITLLFLYFITYSFLGWCVETTFCCIMEKRWVARGFLFGPICPIYGVGAILMILFFAPLSGNLILFYVTATVVMSAWEYFVGWFLETTTKVKYWDYSNVPFNIKGRVCLPISLCWGVLSYITIFLIHPHVAGLYARFPMWLRYSFFGSAFTLLMVDTITTVRQLALTTQLMNKLEAVGQELKLQTAQIRAKMSDRLDDLEEAVRESEHISALKERYDILLDMAELQSRRVRHRYAKMHSEKFGPRFNEIATRGQDLRVKLRAAREQYKAYKASKK